MASNGVCASTEPPDLYWVMAALLSSLTIFGNIVVFGLNFTRSVPQNSTNFIITNLATIDLCIGLWIALLKCLPRLPMPPNGNSFALNVFCRFYCSDYPLWALLNASVFNLLLVTADRYLSVITPFFYKTTFSQQANLLGCVALTWVLGAVSVSYTTVAWTPSGVNSCVIDSSLPPTMLLWGGCWTLFGRFLLPTVLMVMAYAHISYCLSRMPEESQGNRLQKRVTLSCFSVVFLFIICWLPDTLFYFIYSLKLSSVEDLMRLDSWMYYLVMNLGYANSALNPVIYAFINPNYYKVLKVIIERHFTPGA